MHARFERGLALRQDFLCYGIGLVIFEKDGDHFQISLLEVHGIVRAYDGGGRCQ